MSIEEIKVAIDKLDEAEINSLRAHLNSKPFKKDDFKQILKKHSGKASGLWVQFDAQEYINLQRASAISSGCEKFLTKDQNLM